MLKKAHLPVTWLIDFPQELQLAIAIMLLLEANNTPVVWTDRQKAMHISPPCISTGVLKNWTNFATYVWWSNIRVGMDIHAYVMVKFSDPATDLLAAPGRT